MKMPQKSFIFTGISGCGKGTQINNLLKYFEGKGESVLNIETGHEFREFINGNSQTQILSKNIYDKGGIQPAFLACHIWSHTLIKKFDDNKSHLIIDGAPRTYPEALVMDSVFKFYSIEKPNVIHIDIDREQATKRLLSRKRIDDNIDDINARLDFYYKDVVPALEYYKNDSFYNYVHINGNKSIEDIFEEIKSKTGLDK